jgi:transcriptional regulator with XRE-family HTH domain
MDLEKRINAAAAYAGMSQADLARRIGVTPQAFNSRMKNRKFSDSELDGIAEAVGAKYCAYFEFPDGTRI